MKQCRFAAGWSGPEITGERGNGEGFEIGEGKRQREEIEGE